MAFNLKHQTAEEFATRLRNRWRVASREEACKLSWWLIERLNAGDFTDLQVRTVFGLTAGQWTTVKTNKLIPQHDAWEAVRAATGE